MSTLFKPTALVGAIAIAMGFSTSTLANSSEQISTTPSLKTIVVTASRNEQNIENVPARISVINTKEIDQAPISDLGHLLRKDASLNIVQSGGIGQTSSGFIRGTDSKHLLFLKDGVSLNTALDGGANIPYIDLSDIEHIEIVKGPASVQYGTDAIGGVVNVISKKPSKTGVLLTTEFGENNTYKSIVGADLVDDSGMYAQVRGQRLESDGTPVTDKSKQDASFDQKGYSTKIGIDKALYQAHINISENKGNNVYYGGAQDFLNQVLNASATAQLKSNLKLNAQISHFKDELTDKAGYYYFDTDRNEADLNLQWKFAPQHNLMVGGALNRADIESLAIVGEKQKLNSAGYYIQHQFNTDQFHTQAGLRIEDHDQFGSHWVGQLAGRVDVSPQTSFYTNIGTAFKAPTGNQLYYHYENADWGGTFGNPNLKPEESISYEIGFDHAISENSKIYSSLYQTRVDHLIDYVKIDQTKDSTYANVKEAQMQGGEIGFKWEKAPYYLNAEYAYVETENKSTGLELTRRPKHSVSSTLGLENEMYGLSATLIAKSKSKIANMPNSEEMSGYATIDLNGYWKLNPNIRLFTNIKNVGDVKHKTANYYLDEFYINGGRIASAGVTFKY